MSELKLLRKELKEWRRRERVAKLEQEAAQERARAAKESARAAKESARADKESARAAKESARAAQERTRASREKHERLYGPWTVREYVEECHTLDGKIKVAAEFTLVTEGPVVDPGDRTRPRLIVPWKGFPQKQREILNKLPSDHKLPPDQAFPTRTDLRMSGGFMRRMLQPIESEYSLAMNREEAVTDPVESLMKEVRENAELMTSFGIDGDVKFERNVNHSGSTTHSHSTEPSGKNSIADEFCSIKRYPTGESEIVLAVQYKLPHELPLALLVAALDNTTELNLDTGIIDEDGEEFGPNNLLLQSSPNYFPPW
ncbi:hypothetical protein E4U13_007831 [Claviceps humidiphila]|uniref:Uncharacterized protein n=1 Tax=Claviceps humidiphila TaxID=1294629 RepID=A0A9P7PVK6_9HYPO|nr:hypothetical protein E4U13_007831 [Claviceps humidiphila]